MGSIKWDNPSAAEIGVQFTSSVFRSATRVKDNFSFDRSARAHRGNLRRDMQHAFSDKQECDVLEPLSRLHALAFFVRFHIFTNND